MSRVDLVCGTLAVIPNETFLANTHYLPAKPTLDSPSVGLMMLLSTFQYQAPYMSPIYSNAASQMGKAAYVQAGGQASQDKLLARAEKSARQTAHEMGVTDTEMTVLLSTAKVVKDRRIEVSGPKLYEVRTSLTADQSSAIIGLRLDFK